MAELACRERESRARVAGWRLVAVTVRCISVVSNACRRRRGECNRVAPSFRLRVPLFSAGGSPSLDECFGFNAAPRLTCGRCSPAVTSVVSVRAKSIPPYSSPSVLRASRTSPLPPCGLHHSVVRRVRQQRRASSHTLGSRGADFHCTSADFAQSRAGWFASAVTLPLTQSVVHAVPSVALPIR